MFLIKPLILLIMLELDEHNYIDQMYTEEKIELEFEHFNFASNFIVFIYLKVYFFTTPKHCPRV